MSRVIGSGGPGRGRPGSEQAAAGSRIPRKSPTGRSASRGPRRGLPNFGSSMTGKQAQVRVQRVVSPEDGAESWTVLADDCAPVEPVELFLAHLSDQGRSPNTVKAYAHDLKDYFEYLEGRSADWRRLRFDELAGQSAAQGHTADRREDRLGRAPQLPDDSMDELTPAIHALLAQVAERLEVGSGTEVALQRAGKHQHSHLWIGREGVQGVLDKLLASRVRPAPARRDHHQRRRLRARSRGGTARRHRR